MNFLKNVRSICQYLPYLKLKQKIFKYLSFHFKITINWLNINANSIFLTKNWPFPRKKIVHQEWHCFYIFANFFIFWLKRWELGSHSISVFSLMQYVFWLKYKKIQLHIDIHLEKGLVYFNSHLRLWIFEVNTSPKVENGGVF